MSALPDLTLILNGDLPDPTDRRMASITDFSTVGLPDFILGETYACQIFLCNADKTYKSQSGDATYLPRLGIGAPGSTDVVEIPPGSFTAIANGWSFSLGLLTTELVALWANAATSIQTLELEFQLTDSLGAIRKWYRRTVRIQPRVVVSGTPGPDPIDTYLTAAEIAALYPPLTKPNSGYRFKADGAGGLIFQLFDTGTNQFRTVWLVNGALQAGPAEN